MTVKFTFKLVIASESEATQLEVQQRVRPYRCASKAIIIWIASLAFAMTVKFIFQLVIASESEATQLEVSKRVRPRRCG